MKWGSTRGPYDDVHTYVAMTWFNSMGEGWGLLLIRATCTKHYVDKQ